MRLLGFVHVHALLSLVILLAFIPCDPPQEVIHDGYEVIDHGTCPDRTDAS